MKDWQERVIEERYELNQKMERLDEFLDRPDATLILSRQYHAMLGYRNILDERIISW